MKNLLIICVLSVGLVLTGYYGIRSIRTCIILYNVSKSVENPVYLRGWMTIPYLSKTYDIPEEYLYQAIQVPEQHNDKRNLSYFRKNFHGTGIEPFLIMVQRAIADYRQGAS